jgi:flagellar biogenesis protein FliO
MLVASSSSGQQSVYAPTSAQPIPQRSSRISRLAAAEDRWSIRWARAAALSPRASEPGKLDKPLAPSASGAISTVVGSLAIVLGLFVVLAWFSRRLTPAGAAQLPREVLELLGRASLNSRQQVQLVRLGNKLLLVASTAAGTETLTEITDAAEVDRLASLCRRGQPASATGSFTQVMSQLTREPAEAGFAGTNRRATRGAA